MPVTFDFRMQPGGVVRLRYLREEGYRLIEARLWLENAQGELEPTDRRMSLLPDPWEDVIFELLSTICSIDRKVA